MLGYYRTDPLVAGARKRRRLGRRGRLADETTAVADPYHGCGLGWSHWPGAGDRGRRAARARRVAADSAAPVATAHKRKTFLGRRIKALTEELDRVKALLSEYSRDDAQDEE